MNNQTLISLFIFFVVCASCNTGRKSLFGEKKSDHEKYSDKIVAAGLDRTRLGKLWFAASEKSLRQPVTVTLPYQETGYFSAELPEAGGYRFNARRGDVITVAVIITSDTGNVIFSELWQPNEPSGKPELLSAADSTRTIKYEIEDDGTYTVRLQPELLIGIEYTITISSAPALAFPVSAEGNPKLISFWSDPRDGGARSHQGVDISAKFRTPALAAVDGRAHRVGTNRLGGNVVFMRPEGKNYSLYYAHLDTQYVVAGQQVKKGDTIGFVGNTGNAINTPPHLHFGIYTFGGAIDPLPFIDNRRPPPQPVTAPLSALNTWRRTNSFHVFEFTSENAPPVLSDAAGTALRILSATQDWYKVALPDGKLGFVKSSTTSAGKLRTLSVDTSARLLDEPFIFAPAKKTIAPKTSIDIVGSFGDFYLVNTNTHQGWLKK